MDDIIFLTVGEVLEIHRDQIDRYGGSMLIRSNDLLCSAVNAPAAQFQGEYLNQDIFEMAAAYIFYICQDHPFIDGNKRTALASGLVFLELNGVSIIDAEGVLYSSVMQMAKGQMEKYEMAVTLRELVKS